MRVAALYDIHGSLPALEAVLQEICNAGVDAVVCGGDVFPGPMGRECLAMLRSLDLPVHWIMGNGDREVLAARHGELSDRIPAAFREAMTWCGTQLGDADAAFVAAWPATADLTLPKIGAVQFCHATPHDDTTIFTADTPAEALTGAFADVAHDTTVVCGHTHMQFDRVANGIRIVNAGSVGMPYGAPRADWLLLDDDLTFRSTAYDLERAAARVRVSDYPLAESFASESILNPPTAERMRAAFNALPR